MRFGLGPVLVSLAVVGTLGVVHGYYTDRWGPSGQLERALATLQHVPDRIGDWVGEDVPQDAEDMTRAGIKGWVHRQYRNPRTGETVSFLIVCGRGGPLSVHTPDVCYTGAGYRQLAEPTLREVDPFGVEKDDFRVARYTKPEAVIPTQLEIYLAWSRDGRTWEAPDNPRLSLARLPVLYKMYVVREFAPGSRAETADACQAFLRRALPVLRDTLPPADQ